MDLRSWIKHISKSGKKLKHKLMSVQLMRAASASPEQEVEEVEDDEMSLMLSPDEPRTLKRRQEDVSDDGDDSDGIDDEQDVPATAVDRAGSKPCSHNDVSKNAKVKYQYREDHDGSRGARRPHLDAIGDPAVQRPTQRNLTVPAPSRPAPSLPAQPALSHLTRPAPSHPTRPAPSRWTRPGPSHPAHPISSHPTQRQ